MLRKAGFIPDTHIKYQDRRAFALMIKVFSYAGLNDLLNELIFLGDFGDFLWCSSHKKDSSMVAVAMEHESEILMINSYLDEIDKLFPKTKKIFLEGNHEKRLRTYLAENAQAMVNRVTVESEFQFKERGYTFIPYEAGQHYRVWGDSDLYAKHTHPSGGTSKSRLDKILISLIHGHDHAMYRDSKTCSVTGKKIHIIGSGFLGDAKRKEAFGYMDNIGNWQLGFSIGYYDGTDWTIDQIKITPDYTCVFQGKKFKG